MSCKYCPKKTPAGVPVIPTHPQWFHELYMLEKPSRKFADSVSKVIITKQADPDVVRVILDCLKLSEPVIVAQ